MIWAKKIKHMLASAQKEAPLGGWGSALAREVSQKYFSLFIGGKDENV